MKNNLLRYAAALAAALCFGAAGAAGVVNQSFLQSGAGAVARTFQDKARDRVDVKDFGARCNGVHNDTAAIAAAQAASYQVDFPVGVCLVDADIIDIGQTARWVGKGENYVAGFGTVIRARTAGTDLVKVHSLFARIEGIAFDGNYLTHNIVHVYATGTLLSFDHVVFMNARTSAGGGTGAHLSLDGNPASEVDWIRVTNSFFTQNGGGRAPYGIYIKGSNTLLVSVVSSQLREAQYLVYYLNGSGARFENVGFESWGVAANYIANGPLQPTSYLNVYSESAGAFWDGAGSYSASGNVPIVLDGLHMNANQTLNIQAGQPVVIQNSQLSGNVAITAAGSFFTPPYAFNNRFVNGAAFTGAYAHLVAQKHTHLTGADGVGPNRDVLSRASGANAYSYLADTVTGAQTVGFGARLEWESNAGGTGAALGFEVGGTGSNNESQIALYTQPSAGLLTRRLTVTHQGAVQWASGTEPACNAAARGAVVFVAGGAGVKDTFRVCAKDAADVYAYRVIY
jgi:hypothetical protein